MNRVQIAAVGVVVLLVLAIVVSIVTVKRSVSRRLTAIRLEVANGPAALAREKADCLNHGIALTDVAPRVPPDQDGYRLYYQWEKHAPAFPSYAISSLRLRFAYSPEQLAVVQKIVDDNPKAFSLLHQAAGKRYAVALPTDVATVKLRRQAARELGTEAYLLARKGSYAKAISVETLSLNIARQGNLRSTVMGFYLSRAVDDMSLSGFQDIMTMAGPNKAVDEQVESTLEKNLPVVSLKSGLIGDIPSSITDFDSIRPKFDKSNPNESRVESKMYDAAEARHLANQILLIDAADLPSTSRRAVYSGVDAQTEPGHFNVTKFAGPVDAILAITTPYFAVSLDTADNIARAREQVTLAAAAVLDVKAKTGSFPSSLPGTFTDPFTGKQLGFVVNGQTGFIIYSVGQTGTYDGKMSNNNEASYRYPAPAQLPVPATQSTGNRPTPPL